MNTELTVAELLNQAADLIERDGFDQGLDYTGYATYHFDPSNGYTIDAALESVYWGDDFDPEALYQKDFENQAPFRAALRAIGAAVAGELGTVVPAPADLVAQIMFAQQFTEWVAEQDQESVVTFLRSLAQRELDEEGGVAA